MTAPLCLQCKAQRVNAMPAKETGPRRTIDGVRYRNYCSRQCTARAIGTMFAGHPTSTAALVKHTRDSFRGRRRAELLAEATDLMKGATLGDVMKALWKRERTGYHRGYAAAWAQRRKKVAA